MAAWLPERKREREPTITCLFYAVHKKKQRTKERKVEKRTIGEDESSNRIVEYSVHYHSDMTK